MKTTLQRYLHRLGLGRSGTVRIVRTLRRLRSMGVWLLAGTGLFLFFAWLSFPSDMLAWRISHECKKRGYVVDVGDASVSPFGGVGLENVAWTFAPSRPGEPPSTYMIQELDVDVSLIKLLFGTIDVDVEGVVDEGRFEGNYTKSDEESSFSFDVEELPLYAVPKARQALNVPLFGTFGLGIHMNMPGNEFDKATGDIELTCAGCRMGDGETLLFIPGSKGLMAKGVTIPEIDLGSLAGRMNIVDGVATTDGDMKAESDDLTLAISGTIDFNDPFGKSEMDLVIKLLVTEALQARSEAIALMVQTASSKTKLPAPEKGLGYRFSGPVAKPSLRGINSKTREERLRERREAVRKRQEEARKRKAKRDAERAKKKREKEKDEDKDKDKESEEEVPETEEESSSDGKDGESGSVPVIGKGVRVEPVPDEPSDPSSEPNPESGSDEEPGSGQEKPEGGEDSPGEAPGEANPSESEGGAEEAGAPEQ